jgi:hypothetical protein
MHTFNNSQYNITIQYEALSQLIRNSYFSLPGQLIILSVVTYVFYGHTPTSTLIQGVLIHLVILAARAYTIVCYKKDIVDTITLKELNQYTFYQSIGVSLSAIAWGLSFVLFSTHIPNEYHFFMTAVLVGIGGFAITTLAFILSVYLFFIVPMYFIFAFWLYFHGGELHTTTAILLLGITVFYYFTAKRYHGNFITALIEKNKAIQTQEEIIHRLSIASELKDNETGMHITRMSHFAYLLALQYTKDQTYAKEIRLASSMHDVGKIGIPDSILLKPGKLDASEWALMQSHTTIGKKLLENSPSETIRLSENVAYTHHEKYDGTGYPQGLKGEEIPLEGRITAIADVYDALVSERPYKKAWENEKAFAFLEEQAGLHFDPTLVAHFIEIKEEIIAFQERHQD